MLHFSNVVLSVFAVLIIPGPTNTLLVTAAATLGPRRAGSFVFAEVAGYLLSISFLLCVVRPWAAQQETVRIVLQVACATYLGYAAWALWQRASDPHSQPVRLHNVFVTTLLNPKSLMFAVFIFPGEFGPFESLLWYYGWFVAICLLVGMSWITVGAFFWIITERSAGHRTFQRVGAIALGCFTVLLLGSLLPS